MKVFIQCSHCLQSKQSSYEPTRFTLEECTQAVRNGTGVVMCRGLRPVRVDFLAPDISFTDFTGRKIDFSR